MVTVLDRIPFSPDVEGLLRQLMVPADSEIADEVRALAVRAAEVGKPKALFMEAVIEGRGEDTVTINGMTFTSRVLRNNLAEVERIFPYIVTCGAEYDAVLEGEDDDFLRYALDCLKESALFAANVHLLHHLETAYGVSKHANMNPGSGDASVWPLPQQRPLFDLFGDVESLIGVQLNDSFLMHPNKTVSGILYASDTGFITCQLCRREVCNNRRAPFDEALWLEKYGVVTA